MVQEQVRVNTSERHKKQGGGLHTAHQHDLAQHSHCTSNHAGTAWLLFEARTGLSLPQTPTGIQCLDEEKQNYR